MGNLTQSGSESDASFCSLSSVAPRCVDEIWTPADYSFAAVNDFVHHPEVSYEELQWAMLGMATERDKAHAAIQAIEERYIDGCDTYEDWKFMGDTARQFLSENV